MAFSLIEVLVATAVFAVMLALLLGVTSNMTQLWQRLEGQKQRREAARIVLEIISRDLQAAVFPFDRSNIQNAQLLLNPTEISASLKNRDAMFWQSAAAAGGTRGDLATVGYFVRWLDVAGDPRAVLCRFALLPNNPYISEPTIFDSPDNWLSDALADAVAPGGDTDGRGMLADNVLGLWVTLFDREHELPSSYDSRDQSLGLPTSAEVAIVIIDATTARRITSSDQITALYSRPSAQEFLSALPDEIRRGAQIFRTRIPFHVSSQ